MSERLQDILDEVKNERDAARTALTNAHWSMDRAHEERDAANASALGYARRLDAATAERDKAHAELDAARLEVASLRIDLLAIAEAAGRVESIEGQGEHVGSVEEVIASIEEGEQAKHDVAEWQAWANQTAALQLDQTDPDAVLPDDDRRVLIRESCQELAIVRATLAEHDRLADETVALLKAAIDLGSKQVEELKASLASEGAMREQAAQGMLDYHGRAVRAEAQAAVMREALETRRIDHGHSCYEQLPGARHPTMRPPERHPRCHEVVVAEALAPDAGRALLEVVERAQHVCMCPLEEQHDAEVALREALEAAGFPCEDES